ncbi:MAG: type II toxin-antitoxin system HicB family antitoxin [Chloroflexota bacterium]|nr:type II toxin-antitoxin system HicB family antitoxin [Chloroflexota bacterium]
MAKEAIELHLEALRDDGESAPDDRIEVMIVKVEVPAA